MQMNIIDYRDFSRVCSLGAVPAFVRHAQAFTPVPRFGHFVPAEPPYVRKLASDGRLGIIEENRHRKPRKIRLS